MQEMWVLSLGQEDPRHFSGKKYPCQAGDVGLIPALRRSPGEGNGNPLQYYCLGNPMDRGSWQATIHGNARVGHNLVTEQQEE